MALLEGHCAVVTGAAQGIGCAIAGLYACHGAAVVIADINESAAHAVARSIEELGGAARGIKADVRVEQDHQRLVDSAVGWYGRLTIMVNNAGAPSSSAILDMSEEQFESVIDVHLRGAWLGTRAAARVMCSQGRGSIINMSSISGKVGIAGQTNYSAAKAGVVGMTKAAARELGEYGIRVNSILPGTIRTERTAQLPAENWAAKIADVPLRREGTPEEVAGVALFLASDLSSYVSGAAIEVAGGRHA
jgi:3-oxoacyl-[acyl-carrier protein] reductase